MFDINFYTIISVILYLFLIVNILDEHTKKKKVKHFRAYDETQDQDYNWNYHKEELCSLMGR